MSYNIDRTNTTGIPIVVDDATVKRQAGIAWVGQYYSRYGELLHENTLHMLENFAAPFPPYANDDPNVPFNRLTGMLWFDTNEPHSQQPMIKVQNGRLPHVNEGWKRLELIMSDTQPLTHTHGEMWYDTRDLTIAVSRGTRFDDLTVKKALDAEMLDGVDGSQYARSDVDDVIHGTYHTSSLLSRTNKEFDLGAPTYMYRNIYGSTLIVENTHSLIPSTNTTYNLGSSDRKFNEMHVAVVRSDAFSDVIPLTNNAFNLGSTARNWNSAYVNIVHGNSFNTTKPMNGTVTLGTSTSRWNTAFINELDTSSTKDLIPTLTSTYSLGSSSRRFKSLDTDLIRSTKSENIVPNENATFNLGSSSSAYNSIYVNNIYGNDTSVHTDLQFNLVQSGKSKGIVWTGLTDRHSIYVEEVSGAEDSRLVIHNSDNLNSDCLVIRQSSAVVSKDVVEVKYDNMVVRAGNLKNIGTMEIESAAGTGCRQEFNSITGTLMFVFY